MVPAISILLPAYNAEATLGAALRSVQRQSESGWECLVVDDGSTDGDRGVAREFAARDARFRVAARAARRHRGGAERGARGVPGRARGAHGRGRLDAAAPARAAARGAGRSTRSGRAWAATCGCFRGAA